MNFSFYVVDEAALPPWTPEAPPKPADVIEAILRVGGPWGDVDVAIETFVEAFGLLGDFARNKDFILDMAFAGSPNLALTGVKGPWRLGWFSVSLARDVHGVINLQDEQVAAILAAQDEDVERVFDSFRSALEEAVSRGFAVAIIHA